MKTSYSIIIGCIFISVSLLISSSIISKKMYEPANFPNSLSVTTYDGDKKLSESSEFISLYEASTYLRMDDNKLKELIISGKLLGTYTSYKNNGEDVYIFSSSKLATWMKSQIDKDDRLD